MFKFNNKSIIQKVGLPIVFIVSAICILLITPEGSDLQRFTPFFIGGLMGFSPRRFISKLDIFFHYLLMLVFFVFWFFIVPDKIQSILFLLGVLMAYNLKRDLKIFDTL
ncbi:MAG TPA: hypothetical protein VK042_02830 [Atopostipes sp.]|nr:hypothetical protein [Atopostipes sp.]